MTNRKKSFSNVVWVGAVVLLTLTVLSGCHSPKDSQIYFSKAAAEDPKLVQLHRTPLYTVFYDHVLSRCVLHSGHTWGETGGGGGGTGVGVAVFSCDPNRIRERLDMIEESLRRGETLELPVPKKPVRPPTQQRPKPLPQAPPPAAETEPPPAAQPIIP